MTEKTIALIGAGELGSRHLQGLAKCDFPVRLGVVDPNLKSLDVAQKRFEEVPANTNIKKINFYSNLSDLPQNIDLAIVATSSGVRLAVLKTLLDSKKVANLLLEKVLFQSLEELDEAQTLLNAKKIQAYVNCPKRLFESTKVIQNQINLRDEVSYSVTGTNWGLGCNAIHFLDNMAFFTGITDYTLQLEKLDTEILSSKRPGYIEFTGELTAHFGPKKEVKLVSQKGDSVSFLSQVETPDLKIELNERSGELRVFNKLSKKLETQVVRSPFQSELTQKVSRNILFHESVGLPTFRESADLHRPLLKGLLDFYNKNTRSQETKLKIT